MNIRATKTITSLLFVFVSLAAVSQTDTGPFDPKKVRLLTSPAEMRYFGNAYNRPRMQVWNEREEVSLPKAVKVDIVHPGLYRALQDLGTFFIPEGTVVNSCYLYFDPNGAGKMDTTVRFDHRILGVIVYSERVGDDRLLESDWLALPEVPAVNFPKKHFRARGLEMPFDRKREYASDEDGVLVTENSVTVHLSASNPGDQIRVLTEG